MEQQQYIVVEAITRDRTERHRIIDDGVGAGWRLCPPGHANLRYYYERTDRPSGRGRWPFEPDLIQSIRQAGADQRMPERIRQGARVLIEEQTLTYSETWIDYIYAFYRRCYYPGGVIDPTEADWHESGEPEHYGGYLHVAEFFPDHTPRLDLIARGHGYIKRRCARCGHDLTYQPHADAWGLAKSRSGQCPAGGVHDPVGER